MKTSGYVIRNAVKEDAARVDELLTELIRYETEFDKNLNKEYTVSNNYSEVMHCISWRNIDIMGLQVPCSSNSNNLHTRTMLTALN